MKLQSYHPQAYSKLPDFFQAKQMLLHCETQIKELGEILKKHNLSKYFGVSLLHKHFNLYQDEILSRKIENNIMTVSPIQNTNQKVGYIWAYSKIESNDPYGLYPVEFISDCSTTPFTMDANILLCQSSDFVRDYFYALSCFGLCEYLGLGIIPKNLFQMNDSDTIMESDNLKQRKLILNVVPVKSLEGIDSTQTLWSF